jgi:hypothetical protein
MSEATVSQDALLGAAAAPYLKSGYRVESQVPGTLVVVAPKIKVPVFFNLLLTVVTVGFWIPVWGVLVLLPRVNRRTFTIGPDGAVVMRKSWRSA